MAITHRTRQGASTLVIIFIIMIVSLVGLTWFQANVGGGSGQQTDIFSQSAIEQTNLKLRNTLLYLQTGIAIAGMNGTATAANMSGRKQTDDRYRYWYCGRTTSMQVPDQKTVRNTSANLTWRYLGMRVDEQHGVRDNTIYRIGDISCIEAGYDTPLDTPANDDFRMAAALDSVNVTLTSGEVSRGEQDITQRQQVIYNRYWYIYSIMKQWVEDEVVTGNVQTTVRNEIAAQVPDNAMKQETQCLEPDETCDFPAPTPEMCQSHGNRFRSAVATALGDEMEDLSESDAYFGGHDVECTYDLNKKMGEDYPGGQVSWGDDYNEQDLNNPCDCESDMDDGNDNDGDGEVDECDGSQHRCTTTWGIPSITAYVDFTVSCTDQKFKGVPRKSLSRVTWNTDISFTTTENDQSVPYPNSCVRRRPHSFPPVSLKQCDVPDQTINLCQTEADTTAHVE